MGNQQCNECQQSQTESFAYGSHQIVQEQQNVYAVVEKLVDGDKALKDKIKTQLQMRKTINHLNIVRLTKYKVTSEKYGFKVCLYYEYIPKSLKDRVSELKQKGEYFAQRQIFAIIYGVEAGLEELKKHNIKHCCINMETIMCKNNIYKITDVSSTTYVTSYDLAMKGNRDQFLSQKLLSSIYNKSLNPLYDHKDDLFSLGMIALAIAANKFPFDFYIWNEKGHGQLSTKKISMSLKEAHKKYSSRLVKKIASLIYQSEQDSTTQLSTLNENLAELDEEIARVMSKTKKIDPSETLQCTPVKQKLQLKALSLPTYSHFS